MTVGHDGFELLCWNLNPARTLIKVRLTFSTATPTSPFPLFRDSWRSQTQFIFQQPPPTHTDAYLPPVLRGLESPHSTSVDNWTPSAWEIPRRNKTGTRRCRLTSGLSNISTTVRMRRRRRLGRTFTTSQIRKKNPPLWQCFFLIQFTLWMSHFLSCGGCCARSTGGISTPSGSRVKLSSGHVVRISTVFGVP